MEIHHDRERGKFYTALEGTEAVLAYRDLGDGRLEFFHTYTPPSLRGQGIAASLVKRGLQYAEENGYEVVPTCPYVEAYLKKRGET